MSGLEAKIRQREASSWLEIVLEDVRVSDTCLRMDPIALGSAAYHCQQAGEKIVKALLVLAGVNFRRTHDLDELVDSAMPPYSNLGGDLEALRGLTLWSIAYRYPRIESEIEPLPARAEIEAALNSIRNIAAYVAGKTAE
jgi:HEPN domain-containing protein